jgi:TatD DNase family protein
MDYLDIHTHRKPKETRGCHIQNLCSHFEQVQEPGLYSAGLQPWYVPAQWQQAFEEVKKWSVHEHVLAIGECGLDKICDTDFVLQQQVFDQHIAWANTLGKPLIIHCVKAFEETLLALKQSKVPAIFHGYNKNRELAMQIIHAGHYLCFGKALGQPRMQQLLQSIPLERIFLETDDAEIGIQQVYQLASAAYNIDELSLSLQLRQNVKTVFNR